MALTKISRGLLNTGVSDSSDATFLTVDSSENATLAGNLTVSGNLTVTGTSTTVDTVTMNAQNAVIFEGSTADNYETTLSIVDPTADHTQYLINQDGYIPVLAAATTTAISSTPAELNILDGGTSATSTTLADADRLVVNDNGTMVQVALTDLETYMETSLDTLSNVTTVGTIGSGVWQGTAIASGYIAADAITGAKIADDAIDSEHYTDGSIDVAHMAANSIDSAQYVDGSIDLAHMSVNSIDSDQYVDGSIDAVHLAAAQTNITSVGTLSSLTLGGDLSIPSKLVHVGDTDTYMQFDAANSWRVVVGGYERFAITDSVVVNEDSHDADFRVESNGATHMLFVDGGANTVGINRTPSQSNTKLEVGGADNVPLIAAEASGVFAGLGTVSAVSGAGIYVGTTLKFAVASTGAIGINGASYGTDGQVFTSGGAGAAAAWEDAAGGATTLDGLSDAKSGGANFANSLLIGHQTTGTLNDALNCTGVGIQALDALTSADNCTAVGTLAGTAINSGHNCTVVGAYALKNNQSGQANTAMGYASLTEATGSNNSAFGSGALQNNLNNNNTAVGALAGTAVTGEGNVFIGKSSGTAATSCDYSVVIGNSAVGTGVMTGNNNVLIGSSTAAAFTSGHSSVAVGAGALGTTTTQHSNTAIGYRAGSSNTGGSNTFVGKDAGHGSHTGDGNTYVGCETGMGTTSGHSNVAMGKDAGRGITTGYWNTYIGSQCASTGNGNANVGIGNQVLETGGHGDNNVAIGWSVGEDFTGTQSTFIGAESARQATSTDGSVAIGYNAMGEGITTGNENTIVGGYAGKVITSGSLNVCLGALAGDSITTGYRNTMLGQRSDVSAAGGAYQIAIGEDCICTGQSQATIGSGAGDNRVWNAFATNASWARVSDERYKKDIQDNTDLGLTFIKALRPVTFKFKLKSEIDSSLPDYDETDSLGIPVHTDKMYGLIAQEVKTVLDAQGITDFGGWTTTDSDPELQGISQEMFIHPLIKAVQELSAKNEELEAQLNATGSVADLEQRIHDIEQRLV